MLLFFYVFITITRLLSNAPWLVQSAALAWFKLSSLAVMSDDSRTTVLNLGLRRILVTLRARGADGCVYMRTRTSVMPGSGAVVASKITHYVKNLLF